MSNYDYDMDFSVNSSTGMIFNKIKKNSTVLEFGCAFGRMTKAMKYDRGCKVYIVECNKDAYQEAIEYAEDGVCDDILNYAWVEKFKHLKFDAIVFADVLEHLKEPEETLKRAAHLLNKDGQIYVSIPNITHNDVLIKAMNEHFDYRDYGILDRTHVHFWGMENIDSLADHCGLNVCNIEATYCITGQTELFKNVHEQVNPFIYNILKQRKCGEIYQFIITLAKKCKAPKEKREFLFEKSGIQSFIYIDTGNDFNEKEIIPIISKNIGPDEFNAHYVIDKVKDIKRLRFDPIEGQACKINRLSIVQNNKYIEVHYSNHIVCDEKIVFITDDPMVITSELDGLGTIILDVDFEVIGNGYIDSIISSVHMLHDLDAQKDLAIKEKERTVSELNQCITKLNAELQDKNTEIDNLSITLHEKETDSKNLNAIILNKDEELARLEDELKTKSDNYYDLDSAYKSKEAEINDLKSRINTIQNALSKKNEDEEKYLRQIEETNYREKQLRTLISKKEVLLIEKDKALSEKERVNLDIEKTIAERDRVLAQKETYIYGCEKQLGYYRSLWYVKFRHFIGEIYRKYFRTGR